MTQHHSAIRLRACLRKRNRTQSWFAEQLGESRFRLSRILSGGAVMQLRDIANAATLGAEALFEPAAVVADVCSRGVAVEKRPSGVSGGSGFGTGSPEPYYVLNVPCKVPSTIEDMDDPDRVLRTLDELLRPIIRDDWPAKVDAGHITWEIEAAGFHTVGGEIFEDEESVTVWLALDSDWVAEVADRGHTVIDGHFILSVVERDETGRPSVVCALRPVLDLGTLWWLGSDARVQPDESLRWLQPAEDLRIGLNDR